MTAHDRLKVLRTIRKAYNPLIATIALCALFIFSRVQRVSSNDSVTTCKPAPTTNITQANDITQK
jgi:hypothetical protein